MKRTNVFLMIALTMILVVATGCLDEGSKSSSADGKQAAATKAAMAEADRQCGMPNVVNYQEKKTAKLIIEECDRADLICYAYKENLHGQFIFIGKCVGYGLPYSVQYTNPLRIFDAEQEGGVKAKFEDAGEVQVLPQADPAGLFKPDGLSATWLMLINPEDNKPYPIYMEPFISVSPFPIPGAITLEQLNEQIRNGN